MGCPGQARTKPIRKNKPSQRCRETRRMAAAANIQHAALGRMLGRDKRGSWRIQHAREQHHRAPIIAHTSATHRPPCEKEAATNCANVREIVATRRPLFAAMRGQRAGNNVLKDPSLGSDTTVGKYGGGSGSHFPGRSGKTKPCWRLGAWLRPVSRGNRHFKLSCKWVTQTQTTQKKENKYEVKPQYEELIKTANHATCYNQCYEMHEGYQRSDSYISVSTGKSNLSSLYTMHSKSVGGNHWSVIFRVRQTITSRWSSDTKNQSITTPMIALDFSGTKNQSAGHNVALKQNHIIKSHNINYSHVHAKAADSAQLVPFCSNLLQPILTKARYNN
ncbi:hypothetical protein F511_33014 [Dorcoceras hygrometricum]|uniref:Uncharacterized protein n=1 Tax=Dorcoceras hygrometricum TaxID=472368 RepID=A0A2Z7BKP3_9LAMI|nr:hypothetical protein F511_33014 [Dorcoceras hygrometricum]